MCQSSANAGDTKVKKYGARDPRVPPNLESGAANCPAVDKYRLK